MTAPTPSPSAETREPVEKNREHDAVVAATRTKLALLQRELPQDSAES